ncbi:MULTISPECIES: YybH family protein [Streptomyces]|uniref:YybH family protein n=1 Tax=Streptomyces nondiastaticus TaxID=3154512 RepID=A0ABW6U6Y8_9ACTN|nr:nuclear transport factor 2 family protein [Streptomyces sp. VNUA116]WKU46643.1 DUF4440 domain-containing protein [Streptomyces sp. VNUA116]
MITTADRSHPPLPTTPDQLPHVFAARFNGRDAAAVQEVYERGATFVPEPGSPVTTAEGIAAANARFLGLGLPITVRPRHVYAAGDIALLVVDWEIDGTGPDGRPLRIEATATDVARRGADGRWRYVVDNPFGAGPGPHGA